jgi:hypothetical protein
MEKIIIKDVDGKIVSCLKPEGHELITIGSPVLINTNRSTRYSERNMKHDIVIAYLGNTGIGQDELGYLCKDSGRYNHAYIMMKVDKRE